ncbi:C-type mannose receptor 2-like [Palaemon carinicauda]|uniref:C-type mannose receptor 2-like n=1 Tax=Palaemon carinicauda TaxID=392227 RepID=UPI0035B6784D
MIFPLLLLPVAVWGYCDPDFTLVGEKCLYFETHYKMTFEEAGEYCKEMRGASLVAIDSARQFKSLVDYIYAEGITSNFYWVDGNDKETEGVWITSSGKEFPMGTPFWAGYLTYQEPNGKLFENCAHLYPSAKFYINDLICNTTLAFICEQPDLPPMKITNEAPEVKSCPVHYVAIGGKCLSFLTYEETTWDEARLRCREKDGDLAIVNDIELLREINLYLKVQELTDHDFWLGASDVAVEGQWKWTDDSPVPMGTPFWGLNVSQEPDGAAEENHMALLSDGNFYFRDVSGSLALHPLCQLTE